MVAARWTCVAHRIDFARRGEVDPRPCAEEVDHARLDSVALEGRRFLADAERGERS